MISAHESPLAAMAISHQGNRIATASERGTVIRVFNITDGTKLYEFRRGVKRCVSICSLAFSIDGLYLCSSSNTETVHVFKLDDTKEMYVTIIKLYVYWMVVKIFLFCTVHKCLKNNKAGCHFFQRLLLHLLIIYRLK